MRVIVLALTALLLLGSGWARCPRRRRPARGSNPDAAIIWPPRCTSCAARWRFTGQPACPICATTSSASPAQRHLDPLTAVSAGECCPAVQRGKTTCWGCGTRQPPTTGCMSCADGQRARRGAVIHIVTRCAWRTTPPPFADLFATPTPAFRPPSRSPRSTRLRAGRSAARRPMSAPAIAPSSGDHHAAPRRAKCC